MMVAALSVMLRPEGRRLVETEAAAIRRGHELQILVVMTNIDNDDMVSAMMWMMSAPETAAFIVAVGISVRARALAPPHQHPDQITETRQVRVDLPCPVERGAQHGTSDQIVAAVIPDDSRYDQERKRVPGADLGGEIGKLIDSHSLEGKIIRIGSIKTGLDMICRVGNIFIVTNSILGSRLSIFTMLS
jgi:hypothetical protein